jgi:alkylation response protein AidB-like acyl-CoA dehydrogenase
MDLNPDPLVDRLARTMRGRLAPHAPDDTADTGFDAAVDVLRDTGAFAFEAPVAAGGFDLGLTAGTVVATELGRCGLPDVYGGAALTGNAVAAGADRLDLATSLASGDTPVALGGFASAPGSRHGVATAVRGGSGWELSGQVILDRARSDATACCAALAADDDVLLVLLAPDSWQKRAVEAPGGWLSLDLGGMVVADEEIVGRLGTGRPPADDAGLLARARVRQAAYLYGLGQGAYEQAVAYARRRRQFGRPIMEYQAVGFTLARAAVALSAVRLSVARAAWLADTGGDLALAAVSTLALAAETTLRVTRDALQVHGARGMSRDARVHLFYALVRSEAARFGAPSLLWQEAGARRLADGGTAQG